MQESTRLDELEIKLAYQDKVIQDLSSALYDQQKTMVSLERQVKELTLRLKEMGGGDPGAFKADQRPPHY